MLTILQILTLAAAFILPWAAGGTVKFHKEGNEKARNISILGIFVCAVIIALTVYLTFSVSAAV